MLCQKQSTLLPCSCVTPQTYSVCSVRWSSCCKRRTPAEPLLALHQHVDLAQQVQQLFGRLKELGNPRCSTRLMSSTLTHILLQKTGFCCAQ